MFGRSQSGPGGLSINTSAANSPSFTLGSPTASKPATSLFGGLTSTSIQQTQSQHTSGPTGNTTLQLQQTGGLFGSSNQGESSQQQGKSTKMFGGSLGTQGTGAGLFGAQQNSQQTGGLFGSTNAQNSQPQQTGGLFASLGQTQSSVQQPQQPQQGKAFAGFGSQNKTSSLFGNPQALAQGQQTTTQAPPPSLFSSQIGQYQKQQTVPGVKITLDELRPTTRFNDLHEEIQNRIEYADNIILTQIRKQEDCFAANGTLAEMSSQMPPDIEYCAKALETMQQALENDAESIALAKNLVKSDFDDAKLSFQVIQNLSLPQQFHHSALRISSAAPRSRVLLFSDSGATEGPTNIVDYFDKQAEEMSKTLDTYNRNIIEVENYLEGVESNTLQQMQETMFMRTRDGGQKRAEDQVRELAVVLREFGNGILGVAAKVGDTREKIQEHMLKS